VAHFFNTSQFYQIFWHKRRRCSWWTVRGLTGNVLVAVASITNIFSFFLSCQLFSYNNSCSNQNACLAKVVWSTQNSMGIHLDFAVGAALQGSPRTLVLKGAQNEKKCRANVSIWLFCWNKFKWEYLKIEIFYRAILSRFKKFSVTHFIPKRFAHKWLIFHPNFKIQNPTVLYV